MKERKRRNEKCQGEAGTGCRVRCHGQATTLREREVRAKSLSRRGQSLTGSWGRTFQKEMKARAKAQRQGNASWVLEQQTEVGDSCVPGTEWVRGRGRCPIRERFEGLTVNLDNSDHCRVLNTRMTGANLLKAPSAAAQADNGISFYTKKKCTIKPCNNMEEFSMHIAKWKEPIWIGCEILPGWHLEKVKPCSPGKINHCRYQEGGRDV